MQMNKLPFDFKRGASELDVLKCLANPIELYAHPAPYCVPFPHDSTCISLSRPQDDHDGDEEQKLELLVSMDQDIRLRMSPEYADGCFHDMFEGTMSPRTGNALKLAWYASYLHNKEQDHTVSRRFRKPADLQTVIRVLETYWLPNPPDMTREDKWQRCSHDHNDGHLHEQLITLIADSGSRSGDTYVQTMAEEKNGRSSFLHYKSAAAGGSRQLVYNALRVLVLAMHLDSCLTNRPRHGA
jgi:hypothetical protein